MINNIVETPNIDRLVAA